MKHANRQHHYGFTIGNSLGSPFHGLNIKVPKNN